MRCAVLILALMAACYEVPDYRRTHFACKTRSSVCPPGLICSEDHCVVPSNEFVLVEHDPRFLITRDEMTEEALSIDAAAAVCRDNGMRLPTDEEWSAAALAGVERGDGVRCARSVE